MRKLLREVGDWSIGALLFGVLLLWAVCIGCTPNPQVDCVEVYTSPSCKQCQLDKPSVERLEQRGYLVLTYVIGPGEYPEDYGVTVLPTYRVVYVDGSVFETCFIEDLRRAL